MKNRKAAGIDRVPRASEMSRDDLIDHVRRLESDIPATVGLTRRIYSSSPPSSSSVLRDSWLGWLGKYHKTDVQRRKNADRDAEFIYNRLHKVVMLLWLAESAGVPRDLLERASAAVPEDASEPTRSARFRKVVPWRIVEAALATKVPSPAKVPKPIGSLEALEADAEAALRAVGAGFGTPEGNRKVERAAVAFARGHLKKEGWEARSVELKKCGFDLECARGSDRLHVEVKGISGGVCAFILTSGELRRAREDRYFRIYAVTAAIEKRPSLRVISGPDLETGFKLSPLAWMAKPAAAD